ncbi:uncharacterized protein [Primulina eburnea]|uniref:uncharacterized protein isoform X2 n=1 Tax=Primulina eburnea TaxID=1245227 RepID=UPI003C6C8611
MESKISMQEENPELEERVEKEEEEEEDDDDDDGPPPGFQCIVTPQLCQAKKDEVDEEEDEGPPPGFHYTAPKPSPALHSSDEDSKQQDAEDDDDGPPPGWEFFPMENALPKLPSNSSDANVESNAELNEGENESDGDNDGPPPGWEKVLHHQMPPSYTPPSQPSQSVSSDNEMESKQETSKNNDELPRSESQLTTLPLLGQSLPPTPQLQQLPPSASLAEAWNEEETKDADKRSTSVPAASPKQYVPTEDTKNMDKRLTSVPAASPKQYVPSASHPLKPNVGSSSSEKAQLVCGTCRKLLLYPRGEKWVQCPGCLEPMKLDKLSVEIAQYCLCTRSGLQQFNVLLAALSPKLVQTTGDLLFQFKWPRDVDVRIKAEHVRLLILNLYIKILFSVVSAPSYWEIMISISLS